jgi:hypothetical protein
MRRPAISRHKGCVVQRRRAAITSFHAPVRVPHGRRRLQSPRAAPRDGGGRRGRVLRLHQPRAVNHRPGRVSHAPRAAAAGCPRVQRRQERGVVELMRRCCLRRSTLPRRQRSDKPATSSRRCPLSGSGSCTPGCAGATLVVPHQCRRQPIVRQRGRRGQDPWYSGWGCGVRLVSRGDWRHHRLAPPVPRPRPVSIHNPARRWHRRRGRRGLVGGCGCWCVRARPEGRWIDSHAARARLHGGVGGVAPPQNAG